MEGKAADVFQDDEAMRRIFRGVHDSLPFFVRTAVKVPDGTDHKRPAPAMGGDTEAILRQLLAYTDEEIASLRQAEII